MSYEILTPSSRVLKKENLFYDGDTSLIYKDKDLLYKLYLKKEPHRREYLDYLIEHYDSLKEYSIPPLSKLKYENNYGMKMRYIEGMDFYDYIRSNISPEEFIRILKILSKNLRRLNELNIIYTDLHHHNIIIRKGDNYPIYIDLDDTNINNQGSNHLSIKTYHLHNLEQKDYNYEDELLKYANLDRECLIMFFLDYLVRKSIEKLSYSDYRNYIERLKDYFDKDFIDAIKELKPRDDNTTIIKYPYYIDEFLDDEEKVASGIKKVKRYIYENGNI